MKSTKQALIIGAGIGGLTTALYLARNGYHVKIYEKNAEPGGRCGQLTRDGYRFDLGATILLMPDVYRTVFQSLGLNFDDCFVKHPLPTLYKLFFEDGTGLEFSTEPDFFKKQLEDIELGSYAKSQQYVQTGYRFFKLALNGLLGRNFTGLFQFVTLKNLMLLFRLKTFIRHQTYVKRFFKDPHLRTAFTFQNIYVGQDPLKAPALFTMLPASELVEGSFFPKGGMFSITKKMVELAKESGVEIYCNQPVMKINTLKNKATGITTAGGQHVSGDVIIANADLPYVYRELLPDKGKSARIDRLKFSCSAIVIHWALDQTYPQLKHHNVFLSGQYKVNLKAIFKAHSLHTNPSFYVHAPVRSDQTAAPEGCDALSIIIPCGHLNSHNKNEWNKLKDQARKGVTERLKQLGIENIESHIQFEITYLPQTWESVYNLSKGATFGSLAHNVLQMGYFRPHNRHPFYKNLYFAGGSTHPGNGVPLVLLSAKLTSERILNDLKHA